MCHLKGYGLESRHTRIDARDKEIGTMECCSYLEERWEVFWREWSVASGLMTYIDYIY